MTDIEQSPEWEAVLACLPLLNTDGVDGRGRLRALVAEVASRTLAAQPCQERVVGGKGGLVPCGSTYGHGNPYCPPCAEREKRESRLAGVETPGAASGPGPGVSGA